MSRSAGWIEVSVEEIKAEQPSALATGPFGSSISSKYFQESGVPVIRGSNLSEDVGSRLDLKDVVFLSPEKAEEFRRSIVEKGDLIFTCWGTVGQVGLIDEKSPFSEYVISNKQMKLTPDPRKADSLFLYYLFSGPEMSGRIKAEAIGSSVPGFNLSQLRSLCLCLPSLVEQQAIAGVLGALDEKIYLNRRINQTLETVARAIFKSWFVDFDPVREGHPLFGDRFWQSGLGEIPQGWKVGQLNDLFVLQRGFDLPANQRRSGPHPVMAASGQVGFHDEPMVKGPGVTTGRSGVIGKVFLVLQDFWPLNTSLWVKEFLNSGPVHAYHILQDLDLSIFNAGSAVPTLNRNHIHSLVTVIPPRSVVAAFESLVMPVFQLRWKRERESRTLAALRDTLLPKLLSGEIRVKQAEKMVGEAV